jgi:N-acetylneuraminate lyase
MTKVPEDFHIKGILAAPATPLLPNGDINTPAIKDYVEFLAKESITGVFILGTLGEGMSLTVSERKEVASAWIQYSKGRLETVVVHVGTGNLRDSVELARHAQEAGATAVACMSPSYTKPANEGDLLDFMAEVASAAADTPFYYYCINFMTGVYLDSAQFLELAGNRIPNLRGIKVSSRELPSLLDCALAGTGRYDVLPGTDEQLLTTLVLGLRTPIVNGFLGNLYTRIRDAFDKGDIETARKENERARKIMKVRNSFGAGPSNVKACMRCLGLDLGPVRLPLKDMPADRQPALKQALADCGITSN